MDVRREVKEKRKGMVCFADGTFYMGSEDGKKEDGDGGQK